MPHLVWPYQVVALVLVREVGNLREDLYMRRHVPACRRIDIEGRRLIHLQTVDPSEVLRDRALGSVVAGNACLELIVLEPQYQVGLLLRVVLEGNAVASQIGLPAIAR